MAIFVYWDEVDWSGVRLGWSEIGVERSCELLDVLRGIEQMDGQACSQAYERRR